MRNRNIHNYDFSPFFRATIGFDRIADLVGSTMRTNAEGISYPPYNIEKKDDDNYQITLAVAGFCESELSIEQEADMLIISGEKDAKDASSTYLHRGIGQRSFSRRFHLADHIKVTGAQLESGMLHIDLFREVPEALQPRKIAIGGGARKIK